MTVTRAGTFAARPMILGASASQRDAYRQGNPVSFYSAAFLASENPWFWGAERLGPSLTAQRFSRCLVEHLTSTGGDGGGEYHPARGMRP